MDNNNYFKYKSVHFAALEQVFSQKIGQNLKVAAESWFKSFLMTNTYNF